MSKYTWIEQGKEHHTNASFLHWRRPMPYCRVYTAVFSRKHDFLCVPEPFLTDETRQILFSFQPLPTEPEPESTWIPDDIPF